MYNGFRMRFFGHKNTALGNVWDFTLISSLSLIYLRDIDQAIGYPLINDEILDIIPYEYNYFTNYMNKAKLMIIADKNRITKNISEFIDEKHTEYLNEAVNMENDFSYANGLALTISLDIVSQCLKKSVPELLLKQFPIDEKIA
jgi:hypothetical protein